VKVLIVGGGIIGCSAAYDLARAGCRVTLFERGTPDASGLLAPIDESTETTFARLALAGWRLYPGVVRDLEERTGIDVEYVTRGTIYPTSPAQKRRDVGQWADVAEFGVEMLEGEELRRREPALSPAITHAVFVKGDHWLNNQKLVLAYAQAAAAARSARESRCDSRAASCAACWKSASAAGEVLGHLGAGAPVHRGA